MMSYFLVPVLAMISMRCMLVACTALVSQGPPHVLRNFCYTILCLACDKILKNEATVPVMAGYHYQDSISREAAELKHVGNGACK